MKSEGPDGPDFDGWQASTLFVANKLIGHARLLWSADRLSASRPLSGLQASSLTPAFTPNDGLALEGIVACYRGATGPESHGIPCAATTLLKNVLGRKTTSPRRACQSSQRTGRGSSVRVERNRWFQCRVSGLRTCLDWVSSRRVWRGFPLFLYQGGIRFWLVVRLGRRDKLRQFGVWRVIMASDLESAWSAGGVGCDGKPQKNKRRPPR